MDLDRPEWLWLLAAPPILAGVAALGRARRARDWRALGQRGRPARDGSALWLAAAVCLALALARPRWGRPEGATVPRGRDVVVAVDVSRSMGVVDAVPDRLGAAVEAAESLVGALGDADGDRVAVVAFAGRGVVRCPLTRSLGAVADALRALRPGAVQPGGTDLGAALEAALDAFDDQDHDGGRSVVLVSDGEDLAGRWTRAVDRLCARGVVVHAVAVGDADAGHPVPSRPGATSEPVRHQGAVVLSRRSDAALAAIARATGGAFVPLGLASADLGRLYRDRIAPALRSTRPGAAASERAERFPLFLAASLTLLLAASRPGRPSRGPAFVAALAALAGASPDAGPARVVAEGREHYGSGRYAQALDAFERARRLAPRDPVPTYDAAAALFQLGRFDEARALYQSARARAGADAALRVKIDYALGNSALARGDLSDAIRHYDACLSSTASGPDLGSVRRDASVNRRFAVDASRRPPDPSGSSSSSRPSSGRRTPRPEGSNRRASPGAVGNDRTGLSSPAPSSRGTGGAGGGGPAPTRGGTPEDQLADAVRHVRDARRQRLDEPIVGEDREDRKDW